MPSSPVRRAISAALAPAPLALAAAALAGCATPGGSGPRSADQTGRESLASGQAMVTLEPTIGTGRPLVVPLPAARAWLLLPGAYEAVGLPIGQLETERRRLGSGTLRLQGRLGRTRLSDYVDCGTITGGMRAADTHAVTLQAVTVVAPAEDTTRSTVLTTVVATGRPTSVSSGGSINCPTTGRLERRIADLLREAATTAPAR